MPQMAPMNWMMLFIMFIMIFLMFNSFIYHTLNYSTKKINLSKNKIINYWKW